MAPTKGNLVNNQELIKVTIIFLIQWAERVIQWSRLIWKLDTSYPQGLNN